jgi:predicted enzyme related to lactoylglutathione lyase
MIKRIAYTLYPVVEMARARRFYEEEMGLSAVFEHANGQWVEYEPGGCFVLSTLAPLKPSADFGGNIAFEVEDVVALTEHLSSKGYEVRLEVTETPSFHMSVVVDSEGNAVTLCQQKS